MKHIKLLVQNWDEMTCYRLIVKACFPAHNATMRASSHLGVVTLPRSFGTFLRKYWTLHSVRHDGLIGYMLLTWHFRGALPSRSLASKRANSAKAIESGSSVTLHLVVLLVHPCYSLSTPFSMPMYILQMMLSQPRMVLRPRAYRAVA